MRVGIGFDMHPLMRGRKLILGGVAVPFSLGLEGHSDGDALVHSVCDALLGACALGDIGRHFPSTREYKGISSLVLLGKVRKMLSRKKYRAGNIDATVIAEFPRLSPFLAQMRKNISGVLGIKISAVSVKSTTAKKLGSIGRGRAIACIAVAAVKLK